MFSHPLDRSTLSIGYDTGPFGLTPANCVFAVWALLDVTLVFVSHSTSPSFPIRAVEEEYHRRFWEKKLDFYVRLCRSATTLASAAPDSDDFKEKLRDLTAFSVGELQVVASPEVNTALADVLRVILSSHAGSAGGADVKRELCRLAIACRQDSIREFQLDPKQQEEFELNAKIMAQLWDDLIPKPPTNLRVIPQ